jgi:hypothetical protein
VFCLVGRGVRGQTESVVNKNTLIALLALVALGVSVLTWRQYQELVGLRAAAMNASERADFQKSVWDAKKRVQQLEAQLAVYRSQALEGGEPGAPAVAPVAGNAQNRMINDAVNNWLATMNDPEAQRLTALQQRAQISSRYAGLFRSLALPPDKLAQMKDLLLEKLTARNDVMLAAAQQGINPLTNPGELRRLESDMQAEIDNKIQATLGPDGFAQFQTYQQTQGQRGVIGQLQESLSYTAAPLTPAQSEQMVAILGQTGPPRGANGGGNANNSSVTDATIAAAQGVLAPTQVQALQEIQQQQQAGAALQRLMRQGSGDGSAGGLQGAINGAGLMLPRGRGGPGG